MWQPGWERDLGVNGYMYICMDESLHCSPETITTVIMTITQYKTKSLKTYIAFPENKGDATIVFP